MNKKMIILGIIIVIFLLGSVYLLFFSNMVDTNFATEATLRFSVRDDTTGIFTNYEFLLSNEDLIILKDILRGRATRDSPACGFVVSVSITMSDGKRSHTFSPALDGCPIIRVGNSDRYILISYEQRKALDDIFERHGLTFPSI